MKFKILAIAVMVLGMIAAAAYAADITGKWVMEMPGMGGGDPMKINYTFKVDGANLTGSTTGMQGDVIPISEGKINGNDISFVVKMDMMGTEMKMKYKGKVAGDEITLTMEMEGGMGGPGGGGPGGGPGAGPGGGGPGGPGGGMPPMVLKRVK
jgi:hypothetical protein